MSKIETFLGIILIVLISLLIITIASLLQGTQTIANNYFIPVIKQNCISYIANVNNTNVSNSIKEAAINAISDYPLCQNTTYNE